LDAQRAEALLGLGAHDLDRRTARKGRRDPDPHAVLPNFHARNQAHLDNRDHGDFGVFHVLKSGEDFSLGQHRVAGSV